MSDGETKEIDAAININRSSTKQLINLGALLGLV
jgi:hypothetical protein